MSGWINESAAKTERINENGEKREIIGHFLVLCSTVVLRRLVRFRVPSSTGALTGLSSSAGLSVS